MRGRGAMPLNRSIRKDDVHPILQRAAQENLYMRCNRNQIWKCVRSTLEDDDRQRYQVEVLLVPQVLVDAQQCVKAGPRRASRSAPFLSVSHLISRQETPKALGEIVIEQDPQS